jgi:aspartate/methionine/tyrosine aminotransferase
MNWEANVRKVVPYVAGEQPNKPNMIKLNTNECPYPPAPGVKKLAENLDVDALRLYPDQNVTPLVDALADYYKVKPEQVFVGVGSDDVLAMAFLTFFNSEKPILFPDITYSFYQELRANMALTTYPIPMLILHGEEDAFIPMEDIQNFHRINEDSELVIIPGTSHRFLEEGAWDMVLDLTRDWFEFEQVLLM